MKRTVRHAWPLPFVLVLLGLTGPWAQAQSDWFDGNPQTAMPDFRGFGPEGPPPEFWDEFQRDPYGQPYRLGSDPSRLAGAPEIPEPMVFDMIRPLHARAGEQEVNVLAAFPLSRMQRTRLPNTDPFGFAPLSVDRRGIEWAPEYEVALADGFAIEFELPFEDAVLEAYKFAAQYTIGTAFDNQYIHGFQTIIEPDIHFQAWDLTLLYLAGVRFDETWSMMAMFGGRSAAGAPEFDNRTEMLFNMTLFADLNDRWTAGLEVNQARNMNGRGTMLLTPQLHWRVSERIEWQNGIGIGFIPDDTLASYITRLIYSF